jgi:hypothetical protein
VILAGVFAAAAVVAAAPACTPSAADLRWLDQARAAWRLQLRRIPELTPPPNVSVVLFDRRCRWSSSSALERQELVRWEGRLHGGRVRIANGSSIPPTVTSFAGEATGGGSSFVMALPSVWTHAAVPGGPLGRDLLTKAVLLHEASHVAQPALMGRIGRLVRTRVFGTTFNDDSIQARFAGNPAFAASVKEETRLLFAAAAAEDGTEARALARRAMEMMGERRKRWFTGTNARLGEAEDLFLSVEGAGQYVGYSWLIDPQGGDRSRAEAMAGFGARARWWSQAQGLALVLAVERLGLSGWRKHLWGSQGPVGFELLQAALAGKAAG